MNTFRIISFRLRALIMITFCAFLGIVGYLFHLQITQMNRYFQLGQRNFLRSEKIASPRGNIVDRHGRVLATNRPLYSLVWQGTGNKKLSKQQQTLIKDITNLLGLSSMDDKIKHTERRSARLILAKDIPFEHLRRIVEHYPHEKNIVIEKAYSRNYPFKDLACHVVGYLGLDSSSAATAGPEGKMGLESLCNSALKGQAGIIVNIINSTGQQLKAHRVSQALAGKTLHTTLDGELQALAEELFPPDTEGCCIVMDESGGLEVVLSRPSFDPSIFLKPLNSGDWKKLQEKKGFLNRAFSACYPPASLFKLITLAAALETGLISKDMRWHCIGHSTFKGRAYHCNNKDGHGILSTEQALAHSCNIPFFEIGKKIPIDTLADYAQRCGLGAKTGIIFPEKSGLIPTSQWKKRIKKERWWQGETLSAAIGQSSLLVTPLQITCLISSLCTGYRVRPRILADELVVREPLALRNDTIAFLQQCLTSVVKQGTGSALNHLTHFKIRGKSGTAQVQALTKHILSKEQMHHGYFAAHFQYKQEKPKTLVIFLEHAGTSATAVRYACSFLKRYAALVEKKC